VCTILSFEERRDPQFGREAARSLLNQLLLSDDISQVDLPYILACYYWIRRHYQGNPSRLSPILRTQCNERQRKIYTQFKRLSSIQNDAELAQRLTGVDAYDNPLRLLAFVELYVEYRGPFHVPELLQRISDGRKTSQYQGSTLNHLSKACLGSLLDLVATVVYKVGQYLARRSCKCHEMQAAADGISRILCLSNEIDIGKIFYGVAPKLKGGEIALCYSMLLATGLGDDTQRNEMWGTLLRALMPSAGGQVERTAFVVSGILIVICWSKEGAPVLFPGLYKELLERRLTSAAAAVWERLQGTMAAWAALVDEVERYWTTTSKQWRERECTGEVERNREVSSPGADAPARKKSKRNAAKARMC
jgi:hypothetical protein